MVDLLDLGQGNSARSKRHSRHPGDQTQALSGPSWSPSWGSRARRTFQRQRRQALAEQVRTLHSRSQRLHRSGHQVCLSIRLSIDLSISLSIYLIIYLTYSTCAYIYICIYIQIIIYLWVCVCVCGGGQTYVQYILV